MSHTDTLESESDVIIESVALSDDLSALQRERREWSKLISIVCYVGLVCCILAIVLLFVLLVVPNIIGFSHKNFIAAVLSLFFACIILLLYKARDDSRSLIFISIIAIALGCLAIGIGTGQLVRKVTGQ